MRRLLAAGKEERAGAEGYLQAAYELIAGAPESRVLHSVRMGERCIEAALRAGDGERAFAFWRLLVRGRADWDGPGQGRRRDAIGRAVRQQLWRGSVDEHVADRIAAELGCVT